MIPKGLEKDHERLVKFTCECRPDMHEPDEQEITAKFGPPRTKSFLYQHGSGPKTFPVSFDNAFCDETEMGFWLINTDTKKKEWFNLAIIVALARAAQ